MKRCFKFEVPEAMIADRQMTQSRWKEINRYLRTLARIIHNTINYNKLNEHLRGVAIKGYGVVNPMDLLKL